MKILHVLVKALHDTLSTKRGTVTCAGGRIGVLGFLVDELKTTLLI